jgi:hypothetical protein
MLPVKESSMDIDDRSFKADIDLNVLPGAVALVSGIFRAKGTAKIEGEPVSREGEYQLGFTQFGWTDANSAYYRGLNDGEGSVRYSWLQCYTSRLCFDGQDIQSLPFLDKVGSIREDTDYYGIHRKADNPVAIDLAKVPSSETPKVEQLDGPRFRLPRFRSNKSARGAMNFLRRIKVVDRYCTILMLRRPDKSLDPLRYFLWHVSWIADFEHITTKVPGVDIPKVDLRVRNREVIEGKIDTVKEGKVPNDSLFASAATMRVTLTCDEISRKALADDACKEESPHWLEPD